MGLRSATAAAPEGSSHSDVQDFEKAFGGMFNDDQQPTGKSPPAQKFTKEIDEEDPDAEFSETQPQKKEAGAEEQDPLKGLEERQNAAREKYKLQKENKDLKERIERIEKGLSANEKNKGEDNPFKGMKPDDIVSQALAAMEDDGLSEGQAKAQIKQMSTEEIIAKAKEEFRREQAEENEKRSSEAQVNQSINQFKEKIKSFSREKSAEYPLIDGLGGHDSVYSMIEKDFEQKENDFGTEYAQKNMLSIEQAAKKVNESLATEVRNALKSDHVRKFIMDALKDDGSNRQNNNQSKGMFQSQEENDYSTLTNSVHKKVTDPIDDRKMTDEEALAHAFKYL